MREAASGSCGGRTGDLVMQMRGGILPPVASEVVTLYCKYSAGCVQITSAISLCYAGFARPRAEGKPAGVNSACRWAARLTAPTVFHVICSIIFVSGVLHALWPNCVCDVDVAVACGFARSHVNMPESVPFFLGLPEG